MALGRNHKIFNIGNASGTIQGLTRVYHDLSLSGDGTLSSLLGVVGDKADEEVNQYVYDNSATIDNVNTSYQTNSGTFLTAIPDYYATTGDINDLAQSISETYQVKGDYVERNAMDSAIEFATSGKLNASSFASVSGDFLVASSLNGYATESFVEETSGAITSLIPTNYYPDTNPSSFVNEDWVTAQGYITGVDLTPYATKTELGDYQTTAGMIDYAKASALENLENDYESLSSNINSNSGAWNDITAYQNASGTYLTGISIPESATWNDVSITVQTNSADWASHQDLSYISAQVDNKLDSSSFVPSDFYPMTGNPSGFLTAHQDWTDTITAASANAYNEAIAQIPAPFDPTYISGVIDNKLNTTAFSEVSGSFLTAVSIPESADWEDATNTYQSHSGTYLTAVDLSNYYTKSETSGADELANAFANIPAGDSEVNSYVHNNSATIDDVNSTVQSNSANWGQGVNYTAGDYIDITDDTISVTGVTDLVAGNAITITTSGTSAIISSNGEAQVQSDWNVTDSNSKAYIRNKPTIPAAQIQSDWNQTNTNAKDYIKNKPTIPSYTGASGINVSSNIVSLDNPIGLIAGDNITITVSGTSAIVSAANQGGNPEVESYVQTNSGVIDDVNTTYQNASGTYLTAVNIPESADWNDTTEVVQSNSANWSSKPTYDYTDNDLISAINTSGIYASSSLEAVSANAIENNGKIGRNISWVQSGLDNFQMWLNPSATPFSMTTGIFNPLTYAYGAVTTYGSSSLGEQYFGGFLKGNEWYVSNATAGQALRGETHKTRGVHLSGVTTSGYNFDLSINAVRGVNSTGSWKYGPAEDAALRAVSSCDMHESAFGYDASNNITAYNGSAFGCNISALQRLMGIDETVLYSGDGTNLTLTEDAYNFERLRFKVDPGQGMKFIETTPTGTLSFGTFNGIGNAYVKFFRLTYDTTTNKFTVVRTKAIGTTFDNTTATWTASLDGDLSAIKEIRGIHRISG